MTVSIEPQPEGDGAPPADQPSLPPQADRRTGRRVLGIFGLVLAGCLQLMLIGVLGYLNDSDRGVNLAHFVGPMAFAQLLVLMVGLRWCLAGTVGAIRVARICAAVYFGLALVIGVGGAMVGGDALVESAAGWVKTSLVYAIPGLFLVVGIVVMKPPTVPSAIDPA